MSKFFYNTLPYAQLLKGPAGADGKPVLVTVPAKKGVEGEFFSRFSSLTEVASLKPEDVVFSSSAQTKKQPPVFSSTPTTPVVLTVETTSPLTKEDVLALKKDALVEFATSIGVEDAENKLKGELQTAVLAHLGL